MIFVTVGTTMPFDALIAKIDELCAAKVITEPVVCQIGNGDYEPKHCQYFRFLPNLEEHIQTSSMVIGHGGTGTTLELVVQGKKFIAVANPMAADAHQEMFLERLSRDVDIIWTKNLDEISSLLVKAMQKGPLKSNLPCLTPSLSRYIDSL